MRSQLNMLYHVEIIDNWRGIWNIILEYHFWTHLIVQNVETKQIMSSTETFNANKWVFSSLLGLESNMFNLVQMIDNWRGMGNIILENIIIVQNVETRQILSSIDSFSRNKWVFFNFPRVQWNMFYLVEIIDNWRGMWNIILEYHFGAHRIFQNVETREILSSTETFNTNKWVFSTLLRSQSNMLYHVEIIDDWPGMWNIPLEHILIIQNGKTKEILCSKVTFSINKWVFFNFPWTTIKYALSCRNY